MMVRISTIMEIYFLFALCIVFFCNPMAELKLEQKKQWAQTLFVKENMSQKEIASTVGVSEKTIGAWKEKYKWESLQTIQLTTKEEQIRSLYAQLKDLNYAISQRDEGKRHATTPEGDTISKISKLIKNLENETGVAELISAYRKLLEHIRATDTELAQKFATFADEVIQSKLK